ncbi:MAG: site-2 protease family protein [Acidobacteria bacterium]|nr:site-2 protease family protein [Acidobacteriota bacterium]
MQMLGLLRKQFTFAHVSGIPIRGDASWLVVIGIMTALIAASIGVEDTATGLFLGFAATIVFFLSIFIHEYAHAVVARRERLEVLEIVLHPFGGLTRFLHPPETPRAEFLIAIAGPAASFVLSILFVLMAAAVNTTQADILATLLYTLAIGNFFIAFFNMLPGYPLDGGRVLRAYLWNNGRDLEDATLLTGRSGQAIAIILIVFGLYFALVRGDIFTGFWAALVGVFLFDSARQIIRDVTELEDLTVENSIVLAIPVEPDITISKVVDDVLPMYRQHVFPVAIERRVQGLLTLADIKPVSREKWHSLKAVDVMRPINSDLFVEMNASIAGARELCRQNGVGSVAVLNSEGLLVGMFHGGGSKSR